MITKRVVPYGYGVSRSRSTALDETIATTAFDLLREVGYARMSMNEVARRAGVGKDTLYRRWSSKAALVHEVVFERYPSGYAEAPDTGTLVGDVEALTTMLVEANSTPEAAAAVPGLLSEMGQDPEFEARLREQWYQPMRAGFAAVLDAARARGEIPAAVEPALVADVLVGTVMFRVSLLGEREDPTFARRLAEFVTRALS